MTWEAGPDLPPGVALLAARALLARRREVVQMGAHMGAEGRRLIGALGSARDVERSEIDGGVAKGGESGRGTGEPRAGGSREDGNPALESPQLPGGLALRGLVG